jgi:acetyl-CoA acetyltransferase
LSPVYVIGAYSSRFGRRPNDSVKQLAREAVMGALADAGLPDAGGVQAAWFGNCGMWVDGQGSIRGQVCLTPMVREGVFPERVPVINVEAGCATGSLALHGAWTSVLAGQNDIALAIGVERTWYPDDAQRVARLFNGGIDQYDPQEWNDYYTAAGAALGRPFSPSPDRTIFMDTYAMQAAWHMQTYGTTARQIASSAAKNHTHAVHNERAQYRFPMTVEQVLADRPVAAPLTRAMCAPIGDGSAAVLVASERALARLPARVRERAVRVAAMGLSGGKYRDLAEEGLSAVAARRAYADAQLAPEKIDVAEVHDATSFCEIYQVEMLGLCPRGGGGAFVESGATTLGGRVPVNTSGGLVSKGHPVGATGLSMIAELVEQLRGESGQRQVRGARHALAENGGGVIGFDEAACVVTILARE